MSKNIQFTWEITENNLPFFGNSLYKCKRWNLHEDYVYWLSKHLKLCLKNIPFRLAGRIFVFAENQNIKFVKLEELRITLKSQKYPKIFAQKGKAFAKLSQFPGNNFDFKNWQITTISKHFYWYATPITQTFSQK